VIDLEPALIEELEALSPPEPDGGDWQDVLLRSEPRRMPRGRRRTLGALAVGVLGVLGLGTAASAAFGWKVSLFWAWVNSYPPGRTSPIVSVFSGPDWSLVAWMSHKGICISYGAPGAAGNGCEGTHPATIDLWGGEVSLKQSFMYGTVSGQVDKLVLRLDSGRSTSIPLRAEPALHTRRRFFYSTIPAVPARVFQAQWAPGNLLAYDRQGRLLSRRRV
jgi:hypothetical protein